MVYHDHPGKPADAAPLPLKTAADRMGISVSALRSRLKRGTMAGTKDEDGRILVYLPASPDGGDAEKTSLKEDTASHIDVAAPLDRLTQAIQELHTDLVNHDAGLDRLMMMHREQFETNATVDRRLQDMAYQIDTVHTAVKAMAAAFRVHVQETDRLIKALGRSGNGAGAPAFTPPPQKQRFFGRRQSDQDDTPPSSSTPS